MRAAATAALIIGVLALAAPAPAAPERILYVGDSLGVGTTPGFASALGSSASVQGDSRVGRPSGEGLQVLSQLFTPADAVVVFDLGTNDDPANPSALASDLASARRISGRACMVVATLNRPPLNGVTVDGLNRAVDAFARTASNVQLVDWHREASADPALLGPDHVHATPAGYALRAQLFAEAVSQCGSASPAPARPAAHPPRAFRPPPHKRTPPIHVPGIASSGITFSQPLRVGGVAAQLVFPNSRPPYPAVVLIGGTSSEAAQFVARGAAALSYPGPGSVATARAAIAALAQNNEVRGHVVGLWARGEGAAVAARAAAADRRVAAVAVVSPDAVAPAELRDWHIRRALGGRATAITNWFRLRARSDAALRVDPARPWSQVAAPVLAVWSRTDVRFPARASALALKTALAAGPNSDRTFRSVASDAAALGVATAWLSAHLTAKPVAVRSTPVPPATAGAQPIDVANASALYSGPLQVLWLATPALLLVLAAIRMRRRFDAPMRWLAAAAVAGLGCAAAIAAGVAAALDSDGRGIGLVLDMPWPFAIALLFALALAGTTVMLARRGAMLAAGACVVWVALAALWLL